MGKETEQKGEGGGGVWGVWWKFSKKGKVKNR